MKRYFRVGDKVMIYQKTQIQIKWTTPMNDTLGMTGTVAGTSSDGNIIDVELDRDVNGRYAGRWWYGVDEILPEPPEPGPKPERANKDVEAIDSMQRITDMLKLAFQYGHEDFIPMTIAEMELHSKKNHDYAFGGKPTGNFDRVANILAQYPGLDPSRPHNVATIYLLKQLDAALWMECKGHRAEVEGQDSRWGDVSVYAKIIRLLIKENDQPEAEEK